MNKNPKQNYKYELDSLRGVAAFLIVLLHATSYLFPMVGGKINEMTPALGRAYLFVDMFFILSGLVLALNYFDEFQKLSVGRVRSFLKKRFLRIYPLHLVTLCLLVILFWGLDFKLEGEMSILTNKTTLLLNAMLLHSSGLLDQGCFNCTSWNYPSWSISVEWIGYLFLPFIFRFANWSMKPLVVSAFMGLACLYFFVELSLGDLDFASVIGLARCFIGMTFGVVIYKLPPTKIPAALVLLGVILGLHFIPIDSIMIISFILLVYAAYNAEGKSILNNSIFLYLGSRSYSLYMIHAVVQFFGMFICVKIFGIRISQFSFSEQILGLGVYLVLVLLISELSYRAIEVKLTKILKNLL